MTFAERLKQLRDEKAWSQVKLEKRSGVSAITIARIENGAGWNSNTVILLAKGLGVSLSTLFEGVEPHSTERRG